MPEVPGPPPARPAPRRGPGTPAPPKAAAVPPVTAPDQPAPPKLAQIFSPEQARDYNRALDESLENVRKALSAVSGKTLNAEQSDMANRIRTFAKQAEQAREQDLVTAVSLAKRADLLAKDLLERLP